MTLADVTDLLSRVGKDRPDLMESRDAVLLVDAIIAEARKLQVNGLPVPGLHEALPEAKP